jgi:hypothetical protein
LNASYSQFRCSFCPRGGIGSTVARDLYYNKHTPVDARDDHSNQVDDKVDTVEDIEECEGTREREEDRAKTGEGKRERENDKAKTVKCHDNWLSHLTNYFTDANLDDVLGSSYDDDEQGGLKVAKNV